MPLSSGQIRAASVVEAWALAESFPNKTRLIDYLIGEGLGFRRTDMFRIVGNVWEKVHAPFIDPDKYRFDRIPKELMAELDWTRKEKFGIMGEAVYRNKFDELEMHKTVFWSDSIASGLEYEEEWAADEAYRQRYPDLQLVSFDVAQVWHKKGADYGHPMLLEL